MLPNAITLSLDRAGFENSVPSGLENPLRFISPLFVLPRPNDRRFDWVDESAAIEADILRLGSPVGSIVRLVHGSLVKNLQYTLCCRLLLM